MTTALEHLQAGWSSQQAGAHDDAEAHYRRALAIEPNSADAWCLLGALEMVRRRVEEAVACFAAQVRLAPESAEARNNLAVALSEVGRFEEAVAHGREAVRINPEYVDAYNNLGLVLRDSRRHREALATFRDGLQRRPDHVELGNNLGVLLIELGEVPEAIEVLQRATELKPDYAEAWLNLGNAHRDAAQVDHAHRSYERALQLRPDYPEVRYHQALAHLLAGDHANGWQGLKWRQRCRLYPSYHLSTPCWDGSHQPEATLFVFTEQGLGDTVQFARFLTEAAGRVGKLVVQTPTQLIPFLARLPGVAETNDREGVIPTHDFHLPMMSLPGVLGSREGPSTPYLTPDPQRVRAWKERLAHIAGAKVGLFWKGNPRQSNDPRRSFQPDDLRPLLDARDVTWVHLQAPEVNEGDIGPLPMLDPNTIGPARDLDELAALIAILDLVITPDSLGAHLAGALGVPVWVALPWAREWPWGLKETETAWYPSARLFRQETPGRWDRVFERMTELLPTALSGSPTVLVPIEVSPAELLDKLTILEIKRERLTDPKKVEYVMREYGHLADVRERHLPRSERLDELTQRLKAANVAIWDVEETVRRCERTSNFGAEFIAAARTVYRENDKRATVKRAINDLLGASFQEVKSHATVE